MMIVPMQMPVSRPTRTEVRYVQPAEPGFVSVCSTWNRQTVCKSVPEDEYNHSVAEKQKQDDAWWAQYGWIVNTIVSIAFGVFTVIIFLVA